MENLILLLLSHWINMLNYWSISTWEPSSWLRHHLKIRDRIFGMSWLERAYRNQMIDLVIFIELQWAFYELHPMTAKQELLCELRKGIAYLKSLSNYRSCTCNIAPGWYLWCWPKDKDWSKWIGSDYQGMKIRISALGVQILLQPGQSCFCGVSDCSTFCNALSQ